MGDGRWEKGGSLTCAFLCDFAFHSQFAFHAILSASRRPESFYTLLTLSRKQGNTEAQRPQSEMLWFPLWSLCLCVSISSHGAL